MTPTYGRTTIGSSTANSDSSTVTTINATGRPRLVRPLIEKLDFMGTDLSSQFGIGPAINNTKYEWSDFVYGALTITMGSTSANGTTASFSAASGHGNRVQKYDVLRYSTESMLVTDISTDTLTVVRALGGTSSTIPASATIQIVGPSVPENVISPAGVTARGSLYYNYAQQFIYAVQVSDIQDNTDTSYLLEPGSEYKNELKKQLREARRDFERTLFYGQPASAGNTSATYPGLMGGFPSFITVNTSALSSAILTESAFLTQGQAVWSDVGPENMGRTVISNIFLKQVFSSWVDGMRRVDATTTKVKTKLDSIETDLGIFEFTPNYHCPSTDVFVINTKNYKILPYKNLDWQQEELSKDGAYKRGHIKGVFSLEAKGDRAAFKLTGADTTRADYPTLASL